MPGWMLCGDEWMFVVDLTPGGFPIGVFVEDEPRGPWGVAGGGRPEYVHINSVVCTHDEEDDDRA